MPEKLDNERFKLLLSAWPERAIKYLYDFHRPRLIRASEWKTHDRLASQDIVQEAIAQIWEKREWILSQPHLNVASYLSMIITHKSISFFRETSANEGRVAEIREGYATSTENDEMTQQNAQRDADIWKLIGRFPRREFQCLVMKYQDGLSISEIAGRLSLTKKAVERSITSAYKRLRKNKASFAR